MDDCRRYRWPGIADRKNKVASASVYETLLRWMRRLMPRRCKDVIRNGVTSILGRAGEQLELTGGGGPV
jgi:hypothetical protein